MTGLTGMLTPVAHWLNSAAQEPAALIRVWQWNSPASSVRTPVTREPCLSTPVTLVLKNTSTPFWRAASV